MAKRSTIYSISRNYTRCRIWEGDPELIGTSTLTPDKGLTQQQRKAIIEIWLGKNGITPKPLKVEKGQRLDCDSLVRRIDAAIRFSVPIQQQTKLRSFINELIFLNGSLHAEIVKQDDFRVRAIQLCRNKAADYQAARDSAYASVPTCDAVGENEIRKAVADQLATEIENLDHQGD